ncbi:TrgA family protein [Tropicimonas marinistellae]|uniref:TrgA family protein n=1 Tax=Tropicimonas marinistellae TaxID=1739787 RepID=UPI0008301B05|nr:TrgA family protein [Tropicimonas marinistellae]
MPTAAKLFAAVAFGFVAFFASEIFKPILPEGTKFGLLTPINTFLGLLSGWYVMGQLAGRGYFAAAGSGVRTIAVALFYVLVTWSCYEMVVRSTRRYYDGPTDALAGMTDLIAEYFLLMVSDPQVPIVLLAGGVLAAFLSEWASERWA